MALEVKFASRLNGSTINERTCSVKDEKGKALKCRLRYNEQNQSIQILTEEKHQENTNYYLVISEDVKALNGGTMGKACQIRFKIFDAHLVEQLTLRGSQCRQFEPEGEVLEKKVVSKQNFEPIDRNHTVVLPAIQKRSKHMYAFGFSVSVIGVVIAVFLLTKL